MAEERGMIIGDRVEARLDKLTEDVAEIKGILSGFRMAFDQMDKRIGDLSSRMTSIESLQKWAIGLIITGILAIVGMCMTILSKLP